MSITVKNLCKYFLFGLCLFVQACGSYKSSPTTSSGAALALGMSQGGSSVVEISTSVGFGAQLQLVASGGATPYVFSISNCDSKIDPNSGLFTAANDISTCTISVTDANNNTGNWSIAVIPPTQVNPIPVRISGFNEDAVSGTAPLIIDFETGALDTSGGQTYYVNFADASDSQGNIDQTCWCVQHTYTTPGIYEAALIMIAPDPNFANAFDESQIGSVTVLVSDAQGNLPTIFVSLGAPAPQLVPGSNLVINWNSKYAPAGALVDLEMIDSTTGIYAGIISANLALSGSYTWTVPGPLPPGPIPVDNMSPIIIHTTPGRYIVKAVIKIPPTNPVPEYMATGTDIAAARSGGFSINAPTSPSQ